jgi:hypothetical protein
LRLRSLRCSDAFPLRLLLRWSHRSFGSSCIGRTFNSLLLALWWLNTTRLLRHSRLLLNTTRLFDWSWLFHRSRLFHRSLLLCCLSRRRAAALTLVSHLELLSLRAIRRRVHTHIPG